MRTFPRALLLALVGFALATGCIEWSDPEGEGDAVPTSPTPQCTPPTAYDVDVSLIVADATAYSGKPATARFFLPTQVLSCTSAMVPADGNFEIFLDGSGPMGGARVELVLSSDADPAHTAGDLTQSFLIGADGTLTADSPCSPHEEWDLAFSTAGATSEAVTWELGVACPGST